MEPKIYSAFGFQVTPQWQKDDFGFRVNLRRRGFLVYEHNGCLKTYELTSGESRL